MWELCVYIRVAIVLELAGKEGKRGGVVGLQFVYILNIPITVTKDKGFGIMFIKC